MTDSGIVLVLYFLRKKIVFLLIKYKSSHFKNQVCVILTLNKDFYGFLCWVVISWLGRADC